MVYEIQYTRLGKQISSIISDPKSSGWAKIIKLQPRDLVMGETRAERLHRIRS